MYIETRGVDTMYFKIRKSANSQYFFTINADNHQVLCTSETYLLKRDAENAINAIKCGAALAPIKDSSVTNTRYK